MSKTVADILREAKASGKYYETAIWEACEGDQQLYQRSLIAFRNATESSESHFDRAIALASGTAEKPLGEVLAEICRNGHYLVFEVIDGKSIAHRDHINSDWRDTEEADTPDAAVRALRQKVNVNNGN